MTVSSTANRISYVGDTVTTLFAFPYYFVAQSDLIVALFDTVVKTITPLILGTNYNITGTLDSNNAYSIGAEINLIGGLVPTTTQFLAIVRAPAEIQNFHPVNNAAANPAQNEFAYDKLTLMVQRLQDLAGRSIALPDGFVGTFNPQIPFTLPGVANAGCTLITDSTGQFFIVGPNAAAIANAQGYATAAATSAAAAAASAAAAAASNNNISEVDTSGGNVNKTLPAANGGKQTITYINENFGGPNSVLVGVTGTDHLNGGVGDVLNAGEVGTYWSNGVSKWYKLN